MNVLKSVNFVVSVGSVDGVCTSAAVLRSAAPGADIMFAQAFTVDRVDPSTWEPKRKVLLVDLAVNNRDPSMTVAFLQRIAEAEHKLVGILDEHSADDWRKACAEAGVVSFDDLGIKPVSQDSGDIKSSGALLLSVLGNKADEHTCELCQAADAGDRMDFSTHFGGLVNSAVKSRIGDDSRRVHLARHFAANHNPDDTIVGWVAEYEAILAGHEEIVAARVKLGDNIVRINTVGKVVDMTTLMKSLYDLGVSIVLIKGEMFNKAVGAKTRQIAFGCKPGLRLDVVAVLKAAGVECSGFAAKANVKPEDEEAALGAVRKALAQLS